MPPASSAPTCPSGCSRDGWRVTGVDCFTDYYARADKVSNLDGARRRARVRPARARTWCGTGWQGARRRADAVFHLAAQAGVRGSFGTSFVGYAGNNLVATQRVFEARRGRRGAGAWCGRRRRRCTATRETHPCREASTDTLPRSPYGVTKRACEDLARVYRSRRPGHHRAAVLHRLRSPAASRHGHAPDLRRPRPPAARSRSTATGSQSRDFTFVADAVDATVRVRARRRPGTRLQHRRRRGGDDRRASSRRSSASPAPGSRSTDVRSSAATSGVPSADVDARPSRPGLAPSVSLDRGLAAELAWVRARSPDPRGLRVTDAARGRDQRLPRDVGDLRRSGSSSRWRGRVCWPASSRPRPGDGAVPQPGVEELLALVRAAARRGRRRPGGRARRRTSATSGWPGCTATSPTDPRRSRPRAAGGSRGRRTASACTRSTRGR